MRVRLAQKLPSSVIQLTGSLSNGKLFLLREEKRFSGKPMDKLFYMLINNYNYNCFTSTSRTWNTKYNATTGRMELQSNPVALTSNRIQFQNGCLAKEYKENNMMVLRITKLSFLPNCYCETDSHCKYIETSNRNRKKNKKITW